MPGSAPTPHSLPRRIFRWCRITLLLALLAAALMILWSNYVAVPEFIAAPVRTELRQNNVSLEFRKLRLSGFRRIVADDLTITPVSRSNESRVHVSQAELNMRYGGSLARLITISGLRLDGGNLSLAVNEPGEPPRFLSITNLHADVAFRRGDVLQIVGLSGEAFGARAELSGTLRNFSQFRLTPSAPEDKSSQWRKQVSEVIEIAHRLNFAAPPELALNFTADAADFSKTRASISLRADEGISTWGSFRRLRLNSVVQPLTNQAALRANFIFELNDLSSDDLKLSGLRLTADTHWSGDMQKLLTNHVAVAVASADSKWVSTPALKADLASSAQKEVILSQLTITSPQLKFARSELTGSAFEAKLEHVLPFPTPAQMLSTVLSSIQAGATNRPQPISGEWEFRSARTILPRAEAESIFASGSIRPHPTTEPADPSLSFWEFLRPFELPWQLQLKNLTAGDAQIGTLMTRGNWKFPELTLSQAQADLYKGKLSARANLDVQTRQFTAHSESTFDYHQASVLLDPPVQRWLEQFSWESPPYVEADFALPLPPWTNRWDNIANRILSSLSLGGRFEGRGAFRGIPYGLAESHFEFTNFVWTLPDLRITRPEGKAFVFYTGNVTNQEIAARVESRIDPAILAPAFDPSLAAAFQFVRFAIPPLIKAEIRGDLDDLKTLRANGAIAITNFFAKEQAFTDLRTDFSYGNQSIELRDLVAHRGKEEVTAPYSRIDIPGEVMFVTNAISTIDPYIAMSIVGDEVYDAIDPYRFANRPTVTINGFVPLRHVSKANIHFGVSGTDFTYWRFHLAALSGDVYWKGFELGFSNVHAAFYNGTADWSAFFQIDPRKGVDTARFSFRGTATNASLQPLVRDLFQTTNRLEGTFNGELIITSANTDSIKSWNGYGNATLKDGYLWSIPVFGIFSPVLEGIAPGLGSTPVSSGSGNFTVKNSVIYTKDLQVRAPAFRLNYKGNVDLDGNLDARVEAEILRDTWVIGKLFSTALWPVSKAFEAQVTGKLNDPKTKFRYVPKFIFAPFKVLGAIGEAAKRKEHANPAPTPAPDAPPTP